MAVEKNAICFVASTLPAAFIDSQADQLKITKVVVVSHALEASYRSLKKRHPSMAIARAPSGFWAQPLYFFMLLLIARWRKNDVVIFHECCMPVLDLLLKLLKPNGFYFPQVSMRGFNEITFEQYPKTKLILFLKIFGLRGQFKYYLSPPVGENRSEYAISVKEYPSSIVVKDIQYSRDQISKRNSVGLVQGRKILFVAGKSCVSNEEQIELYRVVAEYVRAKGYSCYVKDHPNPSFRINLQIEQAISIDPLVPVELLDKDYSWIVGVSSSALLSFGDRSVSLLNLLGGMSSEDREICANHLNMADTENKIRFLDSLEEFDELL